jgi:hypothetical protein
MTPEYNNFDLVAFPGAIRGCMLKFVTVPRHSGGVAKYLMRNTGNIRTEVHMKIALASHHSF